MESPQHVWQPFGVRPWTNQLTQWLPGDCEEFYTGCKIFPLSKFTSHREHSAK